MARYESWNVHKWLIRCDECGKSTHIYKNYTHTWGEGYDWADGESFYICPLCELKSTLTYYFTLARCELKVIYQWYQFNHRIASGGKHYSYKAYRKIFGGAR